MLRKVRPDLAVKVHCT
jgi:hypothetical protein